MSLLFITIIGSIKLTKQQHILCRNCKQYYNNNENTKTSCKIHKGKYIGAEASKHAGNNSLLLIQI